MQPYKVVYKSSQSRKCSIQCHWELEKTWWHVASRRQISQFLFTSGSLIFIRSYCYTVWSVIGIILSSVCPSLRLSVC